MDNLNQKKIGALIGYIYTVLQAVISIVYIPLLLNGIGKNEYGLYQIVGSVIAYFSAMEAPLCAAVLKFYTEYKVKDDSINMENTLAIGRRIFGILSVIMIVVSVPTILIIQLVFSRSFTSGELREAILMFGIMVINLVISMMNYVYVAVINANERYVFLKSMSLILLIIQPILVILIIREFPYAFVIVLVQMLLGLLLALARMVYAKRCLYCKIRFHHKDPALLRGMMKLFAATFFVAIADQVFQKTDQLILGSVFGTGVTTEYSIGAQINSMYISVSCVLGGMLLPSVTKIISKGNDTEVSSFFAKIGRIQSYLVACMLFGVIAFGREFIFLIAGEGYELSYYVAILLMCPYAIDLIQTCGGSIMQAKNKYGYRAVIMFVAAILNVALTLLFVKIIGAVGAALATTVTIIISNGVILNVIYHKKMNLHIGEFFKQIAPIWLVALLMLPISLLINQIRMGHLYLQFIVHVALFVSVYMLLMYLIAMSKDERSFVLGILKRGKT